MARRADPIIEFVGVPGAGKSTIARAFRPLLPGALGLQLPRVAFRGSPALVYRATRFLVSLRPFEANDIHRMVRLVEAHRVYVQGVAAPLLLEQGLMQKLWAMIADRSSCSDSALEALVAVLAKAPPDVIVRVRTPFDMVAARIQERPHGNSRYERMDATQIMHRLGPAEALYDTLMELYRRHSTAAVIELSGADPVEHNVARLEAFMGKVQQVNP